MLEGRAVDGFVDGINEDEGIDEIGMDTCVEVGAVEMSPVVGVCDDDDGKLDGLDGVTDS